MKKTILLFPIISFASLYLMGCGTTDYEDGGYYAPDGYVPYYNNERYAAWDENDFKLVSVNPTSVFSVDVDKASYSNARDYIENGMLPPEGSIRTEEFVNYFNYSYPEPTGDDLVSLNAEIGKCAWTPNHYLLKLGLKAKTIDLSQAPASNLVFLIDVSGSMREELPLLVDAFDVLMDGLRDKDRVAIVTYASGDKLVLQSTQCTKEGRKKIYDALHSLSAGGSTHGAKGIQTAYDIANKNFISGGNNRVILATDVQRKYAGCESYIRCHRPEEFLRFGRVCGQGT